MSFNPNEVPQWSFNEKRMLKYMLEQDGMQFMRYFFKLREGTVMLRNWHHYIIEYVLQAVIDLKINRLVINIAPGYTKTEQAVINLISRGLAINPSSKYIHTSYNRTLVNTNSSKIRQTIRSPEYQELWPMVINIDSNSKGEWYTEFGGGMLASSAAVTGFRAGRMDKDKFTGALIVDDPVKPSDAYSTPKRTSINNDFNNTLRSRLAVETVPMIVIMQRIHEDDLSGYLLSGGSGDTWHHLNIQTHLSEEALTAKYNKDYTHGVPISIDGILKAMHSGVPYEF